MASLSYYHNRGNQPLKYMTLGQLLEDAALKFPNILAVDSVEQNSKLTYSEAIREADKFATGLIALGMQQGERLGLWSHNCIEWCIVNWACMRAGIILVPLNPANVASEMEYCINKVGIKMIVCPYVGKYNRYFEIIMEMLPELRESSRLKFSSSKLPSLKGIILISDEQAWNTYTYKEVIEMGIQSNTIDWSKVVVNPDDACYINFSSGTTGKPKAVTLSHFQTANSAHSNAIRIGLDKKHHLICVQVPLFHAFGTIVSITAAAHYGSTIVLPAPFYNSTRNFEVVNERRCTIIFGSPTMFTDLINVQANLGNKLNANAALIGGARCSADLVRKIKDTLNIKDITLAYGLTETSSTVFMALSGEDDVVGYVCDYLEVKIIDENGRTLPTDISGEICVRGYSVMLGYWDDQESTKNAIVNGWFKTGDIGTLNSSGYAKILGRMSDLIIRGGENIYPKEIEELLDRHPSVVEAQVIGVPHGRLGEEVCACIVLKQGAELTVLQLTNFCKNKIAQYKIPTQLKIVHEFPRTASGKVQKVVLREIVSGKLQHQTSLK